MIIMIDLFIKQRRLKPVNERNQNDRLEILKAKCEQEIQAKEREIQTLKAKLATLQTLAQEAEKLSNPEAEPDKYANMGMTESILDAVNHLESVSVHGATASQIRDYMIAHGFNPSEENPHNFSIAVSVTLKRLSEQSRIKKTEDETNNFFKPVKFRIKVPIRRKI